MSNQLGVRLDKQNQLQEHYYATKAYLQRDAHLGDYKNQDITKLGSNDNLETIQRKAKLRGYTPGPSKKEEDAFRKTLDELYQILG